MNRTKIRKQHCAEAERDQGEGPRYFTYGIIGSTLLISPLVPIMNMYNVSAFLDETDDAFSNLEFSSVILDVHNLSTIDGTAVGALMVAVGRMRTRRNGGEIVLVSGSNIHKKVLDFVGSKVKVFHTREEALAYFSAK